MDLLIHGDMPGHSFHVILQKTVESGVAPVSVYAAVSTGANQALSFGQKVTYDCPLANEDERKLVRSMAVNSNRSKRSFGRRCQKVGTFDGGLQCRRVHDS